MLAWIRGIDDTVRYYIGAGLVSHSASGMLGIGVGVHSTQRLGVMS